MNTSTLTEICTTGISAEGRMKMLEKLYPDLTWGQVQAIRQYWRVFYVNPQKYKGTQLEDMVFDWLKTDGKELVKRWDNMDGIKD